jgi:hypothetical protein
VPVISQTLLQVFCEGEAVLHAGKAPTHYCILVEGEFGVYPGGDIDGECIQTMTAGQVFGEYALLMEEPLKESLVAHGRGYVLLLAAEDWKSIMRGGLSAALVEKMHFLMSLPQFKDLGELYLRTNVMPVLQVQRRKHDSACLSFVWLVRVFTTALHRLDETDWHQ